MKLEGSNYVLNSGRVIYTNGGILGITPYNNDLYQGYDGIYYAYDCDTGKLEFTLEDRKEIALYMAQLWLQWVDFWIDDI